MFEKIFNAWKEKAAVMGESPWFVRLAQGQLDLHHYKGYLLETYHHAGLNPQIQAYTTMFFKNNPREIIGKFFLHAKSEISHDLLAANDLVHLGVDREYILSTKPLATTAALNAFALYLVQFISPVSYLGYLFHLEFLPTQNGPDYINKLKEMGIPDTALTFIEEHSTVDVGHNRLMKDYVEHLVKTNKDLDEVVYAAHATCDLHLNMMEAAFKNGEKVFREPARVLAIN